MELLFSMLKNSYYSLPLSFVTLKIRYCTKNEIWCNSSNASNISYSIAKETENSTAIGIDMSLDSKGNDNTNNCKFDSIKWFAVQSNKSCEWHVQLLK